eukprot:352825-Chlamydomonas_euryale.AAC.2
MGQVSVRRQVGRMASGPRRRCCCGRRGACCRSCGPRVTRSLCTDAVDDVIIAVRVDDTPPIDASVGARAAQVRVSGEGVDEGKAESLAVAHKGERYQRKVWEAHT